MSLPLSFLLFILIGFILIVLTGFAISLFIIVDISFIGQVLVLNLIFCLLTYNNDPSVIIVRDDKVIPILLFILHILGIVTTVFYPLALNMKLQKLQKFFTGINSPIGVFNERHQFGFYTYKIFTEDGKQLLNTFCENGFPSKYQFWFPRFFQSVMYPVTDFCLSIIEYGEPNEFKQHQLVDALYCAYLISKVEEGTFILSVKKFDKGDTIESYTKQNWINIFEASFSNGSIVGSKLLNLPPLIKHTFREV